MSFVSVEFIILVILTLFVYYLPPFRKWQPLVLIAAGLVFYGYDNHYRSLLLISSALINFSASYLCLNARDRRLQVLSTTVGVILNLFLLVSFKYGKALALTLDIQVGGTSGIGSVIGELTMPIGLSFFTFQGITLLVDALRNKINVQFQGENRSRFWRHGTATFLFIGFLPTLLSGPIMKAHQFMPQIGVKRFKDIDWQLCAKGLILGYFLKMVIADNLKDQTFWLAYPHFIAYSPTNLLIFLLGYSVQIFADFAGYSLIAIAVARLAGYGLPDNFNFPYISTTFSNFWRRWHISLSTWLRDYLYIPSGRQSQGFPENVRQPVHSDGSRRIVAWIHMELRAVGRVSWDTVDARVAVPRQAGQLAAPMFQSGEGTNCILLCHLRMALFQAY